MRPPFSPTLIDHLFGIPFLTVHWYGVLIISGAILAAYVATQRARRVSIAADHVWNQLMLGLVLGILGARLYYVAFEWQRYAASPWEILHTQGGGLAIHGGLIGATLAVLIYTRYVRLPLLPWLDICTPTVLIGQAIGRWGNFFNMEAYGRPTTLPWGLDIPQAYRLPPYDDIQRFPPETRFHPTFLYESLLNLVAFGLILLAERRLFGWLKPGDLVLLYGILYSAIRFFTEGLRTDSLCIGPYTVDGSCVNGLRIAQVVSLTAFSLCILVFAFRHRSQASVAATV